MCLFECPISRQINIDARGEATKFQICLLLSQHVIFHLFTNKANNLYMRYIEVECGLVSYICEYVTTVLRRLWLAIYILGPQH